MTSSWVYYNVCVNKLTNNYGRIITLITEMPHGHHGASNHQKLKVDYFIDSVFGLLTKYINASKLIHGPLARYVKLRVAHAPGMPGTLSPPPRASNHDMDHGTCVTHMPRCMPGSLTNGFLWSRWRGKRSRHSQRMGNPQRTYLVRGTYSKRVRR